ncbi:hypothetical protein, partial [Pseudomonas aeruginosa]|uniref:hypothetical protein n=1 Tax=Pseudomonas aeruginosa TaxID=287 RepID=UPI003CC5DD72
MFSELGFSNFDVLLPIACTIGAIFGSLAQTIIANYNLNSLPRKEGEMKSASPQLQEMRSAWLFLRLFVGGVLGFVVGLYFVGALQETPAVFAKIWALCSGQPIPDSGLSFSSATAGGNPSLN